MNKRYRKHMHKLDAFEKAFFFVLACVIANLIFTIYLVVHHG